MVEVAAINIEMEMIGCSGLVGRAGWRLEAGGGLEIRGGSY